MEIDWKKEYPKGLYISKGGNAVTLVVNGSAKKLTKREIKMLVRALAVEI